MSETAERKTGFWRGLWLFILWVIRLIVAIGLGVLLGVAIYYVAYIGIPWFYNQVLNPVQVNRVKIDFLQSDLESLQTSVNGDLQEARNEIISLQQRVNEQAVMIATLEGALATERATRGEVFDRLRTDVSGLDETIQKQGETIEKQGEMVGGLEGTLGRTQETLTNTFSSVSTNLDQIDKALNAVQQEVIANQEDTQTNGALITTLNEDFAMLAGEAISLTQTISEVRGVVMDLRGVITMPIQLSNAFARRLVLMQASQAILQARIDLLERNAGLAASALEVASNYIETFISLSTDIPAAQLEPIAARAKTAQQLIESDPFAAAQEMQIIWNSLARLISRTIVPEGVQTRPPTLTTTVPISPTLPLTETAPITGTAPITATQPVTPTQ